MPTTYRTEENPIWQQLRQRIGDIGQVSLQEKLRKKTRQEELEDAIKLYQEKMKAQQEYGGMVSVVDPQTGEVKTIYAPGAGKGKVITKPQVKVPPKMTKADLELLQSQAGEQAYEKYPMNIRGRIAAQLTPWETELETKQRKEYGTIMKPHKERFAGQFTGQPLEAAEEAVTEDTETQALIEEYNTTTNPQRLKELEDLLTAKGVRFE